MGHQSREGILDPMKDEVGKSGKVSKQDAQCYSLIALEFVCVEERVASSIFVDAKVTGG